MKGSIVQQLRTWAQKNKILLNREGVTLQTRFEEPDSEFHWKGSIGLIKDDIFVSFTVWERTILQTELIVVNGSSGETIEAKDDTPANIYEIESVLNRVVQSLINKEYTGP
jgi:hypothetical protein